MMQAMITRVRKFTKNAVVPDDRSDDIPGASTGELSKTAVVAFDDSDDRLDSLMDKLADLNNELDDVQRAYASVLADAKDINLRRLHKAKAQLERLQAQHIHIDAIASCKRNINGCDTAVQSPCAVVCTIDKACSMSTYDSSSSSSGSGSGCSSRERMFMRDIPFPDQSLMQAAKSVRERKRIASVGRAILSPSIADNAAARPVRR